MEALRIALPDRRLAGLDPAEALAFVADPRFGGIASFIGQVRNHNHGRVVTGLDYDMFEPLARRVITAIAARAEAEVGAPLRLFIGHARGELRIGDVAMLIAAGTPHRAEAFRACRLVVEAVKHEAPIWKQEHYVDGDSAWSEGCSLCADGAGAAQPHAG